MKKITKGSLRRRLVLGLAGVRGSASLLSSHAYSKLLDKELQQNYTDQAMEREAQRFVQQLGQLKGAYVKIGQMLALYAEHLLPKPIITALHTLEAQTSVISWENVSPQFTFSDCAGTAADMKIEQRAFAAASLAQVHKSYLRDKPDQPLCVKVQYPGISDTIEDDFSHVMQLFKLTRWVNSGRQLEQFTLDLKQKLLLEVDYGYELSQALRVAELLQDDKRYKVPTYYCDYCNAGLLTMEFVDAVEVTDPSVKALSQERRNRLAESMLELFFKEAFDWSLMQTDPNFGNYRILIDPIGDNDRIVLLDFGAVHDLSTEFSRLLKQTILAAHFKRTEESIDGLMALNCLTPSQPQAVKESFAEFCSFILEPFSNDLSSLPSKAVTNDNYDWQNSLLLKRAAKRGSQMMFVKGFTMPPPEFMLMVRKLTGVFTFVSALGAKTNSAALLERYND